MSFSFTWQGATLGANTFAGIQTVTSSGTSGGRQAFVLNAVNSAPAVSDGLYISFNSTNASAAQVEVARVTGIIVDTTAGAEHGQLRFAVSSGSGLVDEIRMNGTSFAPVANDGIALGTTSLSFADLFLASGAVINFANGNYTITHSSATLTIGEAMNLAFGTTTGTKIGTATTQKIGFFNATPIVKPTGVAVDAAGIHAALVSLGLIAS